MIQRAKENMKKNKKNNILVFELPFLTNCSLHSKQTMQALAWFFLFFFERRWLHQNKTVTKWLDITLRIIYVSGFGGEKSNQCDFPFFAAFIHPVLYDLYLSATHINMAWLLWFLGQQYI